MNNPYVEMVARGVARLDEVGPAGWRDRINVGRLILDSWQTCILGQIYGDKGGFNSDQKGRTVLFANVSAREVDRLTYYGFDILDVARSEMDWHYRMLRAAWVDALTAKAA